MQFLKDIETFKMTTYYSSRFDFIPMANFYVCFNNTFNTNSLVNIETTVFTDSCVNCTYCFASGESLYVADDKILIEW